MRSTTAAELGVLASLNRQVTLRLKVQNGSGTMIDLTSWLQSIKTDDDVDHPVAGITIEFRRDHLTTQSLSPFRSDSTLNRLNDGVTFSPQLDINRVVTFEAATTAIGASIQNGDFKLLFKGTIDTVNFEQSPVSIVCRDLGAPLVDRFVETEKPYGTPTGRSIELVKADILDDNFGVGVVPVYTPVSPGFNILTYQQQKQSLSDGEQALDQLIGYDSRYWWDDATAQYRYTFQNPPRSKVTPDYTFAPNGYYGVSNLNLDLTNIRNAIQISYRDSTTKKRTTTTRTDATSITKYGRRFFLVQEADTSPINTASEANSMGDSILSDLKDPKAELEIELPFHWPAQLWDLYRFSANGVHFDSAQDLAVVNIRHELSANRHRTFVRLRGKPAGAYLTWLGRGGTIGGTEPGGSVVLPIPRIIWLNTETDDSVWKFQFDCLPGAGGGGTNLSYTITTKRAAAAELTISSGDGSVFPLNLNITRDARIEKVLRFIVTDAATGLSAEDRCSIPSVRAEVNDSGAPKRGAAGDDGDYNLRSTSATGDTAHSGVKDSTGSAINKSFHKSSSADPDHLDSIPDGSTYARILGNRLASGIIKRGGALDDGLYALRASETDGSTKVSGAIKGQGSIVPAPMAALPFSYAAGGAGAAAMWVALSWSAFTVYLPDGTTISIPASSTLATPPSPSMSQVALGSLGARTLFARIGYTKNGMVYRVGAEASLAVSAFNVLKITSPASVAGYDGWAVMVGSATNAEKIQDTLLPFGTDWTEPSTGFDASGTAYNNTNWPNSVIAVDLNINTTYFFYPWWDLPLAMVVFPDKGQTSKTAAAANQQNSDGRMGLSPGAMSVLTPAGGGSGSGTGNNGGGKYL